MGFILKKLYIPVLLTTLLVACGDDSSSNAVIPFSENSSDSHVKSVSSSSGAKTSLSSSESKQKTSSNSVKENKSSAYSSSSSLMELDTLEGLDDEIVYYDASVLHQKAPVALYKGIYLREKELG